MPAGRANRLIAEVARLGTPPPGPAPLRRAGKRKPSRRPGQGPGRPRSLRLPGMGVSEEGACLTSYPPRPLRAAHARPRPAPRVPARAMGRGRGVGVRRPPESLDCERARRLPRRVTAPRPALLWSLLPAPFSPPLTLPLRQSGDLSNGAR